MRWIACGLAVIVLVATLGSVPLASAGATVREVTVAQAREMLRTRSGKPGFAVLDVRTPGEFAEGRLAGAVNLDVQSTDFDKRLAALDRGKATWSTADRGIGRAAPSRPCSASASPTSTT
jgi:hypothetical protein